MKFCKRANKPRFFSFQSADAKADQEMEPAIAVGPKLEVISNVPSPTALSLKEFFRYATS
jgi:hypothetical protein